MTSTMIRIALERDLPAINDIYNHYVRHSTTSYDYEIWTLDQRREWFNQREAIHPVTVAQRDGVVGWASLGPFRHKAGYRATVENSVYVHPDHQRSGVGSALLLDAIDRARELGVRTIVAGIDAEQTASLELHRKCGFHEVARFEQVGFKFGRWLDVVFMQILLANDAPLRSDARGDDPPG